MFVGCATPVLSESSDGSAMAPVSGPPLKLAGTSVALGSSCARVTGPTTLVFSGRIDPATVTAESVWLAADGVHVPVDLRVVGRRVVLTPRQPLAYRTGYVVTATTEVRGANGAALTQDVEFPFMTRSVAGRLWCEEFVPPTETQSPASQDGYVAVSASGDAMLILVEYHGTSYLLRACRYDATIGWLDPETIAEVSMWGGFFSPAVTMDSAGRAMLLVMVDGGGRPLEFQARFFSPETGWSRPVAPDRGNREPLNFTPQILRMSDGRGAIVWITGGSEVCTYDLATARFGPPISTLSDHVVRSAISQRGVVEGLVAVEGIHHSEPPPIQWTGDCTTLAELCARNSYSIGLR